MYIVRGMYIVSVVGKAERKLEPVYERKSEGLVLDGQKM